MSILPSKLSDGHAAQTLESAQNGCAAMVAVQETWGREGGSFSLREAAEK